jgi:2'-hydroxyisoflavone reductase
MRLLVLGGTRFVGRAIVDDALQRGWSVTVFNRGTRPPPPGVTALQGDRTAPDGLAALEQGTWDIAVDTWSDAPSAVRDAADLLAPRVGHYVYVSSRSVYTFPAPAGADEDAPVVEATRDDDGEVDYARAKAGGELAATTAFGDRALLLRAGLILGPHEDIGRLPWWLDRIARGGEVLAPGPADTALQFIDARDLAAWALTAAERQLGGPYNTVSEPGHATMEQLLDACVQVTGADADLVWTDPETILAADIQPWTDLPIWLPPGEAYDTLHQGDVSRAMAAGLQCRPVLDTVADTWAWMNGPDGRPAARTDRPSVGLDPEVEAQVLASR